MLCWSWCFFVSAESAARVAKTFGLLVSPAALLQSAPAPQSPAPRVLGIDDFAFRLGQTYGTILVDKARRRPVKITPFVAYLEQRWKEGEHNATRLFQEI